MEELFELKDLLLKGDIKGALDIVEELEDMSKKDIIDNIRSYAVILLLHLIKRSIENRTTKSWDISIANSVLEIQLLNRRRKGGGQYLDEEDLQEAMEGAWKLALNRASRETKGGKLSAEEIAALVDKDALIQQALQLINQK